MKYPVQVQLGLGCPGGGKVVLSFGDIKGRLGRPDLPLEEDQSMTRALVEGQVCEVHRKGDCWVRFPMQAALPSRPFIRNLATGV